MKNDFDKFRMEAMDLFKKLLDNGDVKDAKRLWRVLGKFYGSKRIVSKNDFSVINEFLISISFIQQFPQSINFTYDMVAKKVRPLIIKKYNLGRSYNIE